MAIRNFRDFIDVMRDLPSQHTASTRIWWLRKGLRQIFIGLFIVLVGLVLSLVLWNWLPIIVGGAIGGFEMLHALTWMFVKD